MPRRIASKVKANESVMSTAEAEDITAKVELLTKTLKTNEKQRCDVFKATALAKLRAIDEAMDTWMTALPEEHLEMNLYEYMRMKKEEAEGKPRISLNNTLEVKRPEEAKENTTTVGSKSTMKRGNPLTVKSANVPPVITTKYDSTKPLTANSMRVAKRGELLFSASGSLVLTSGNEMVDETVSKAKSTRGRRRLR